MNHLILFLILSIPIILFSWRTLLRFKSHGFYRFISWESIAWIFTINYKYWFTDPLSILQIISWILLLVSIYMVLAGVLMLRKKGKPAREREDESLYLFEKTSALVKEGIYRYIRHPLYSSLLFLTWGIYLKNPDIILLPAAAVSTISLVITAILDEKECKIFFGAEYLEYMKRTRRFIPFII